MSSKNEDVIRGSIDAINSDGPGGVDRWYAQDWVGHGFSSESSSITREDFKEMLKQMWTASPDIHLAIEDVVVGQDRAAKRLMIRGTETGRRFAQLVIDIDRIRGDKIAETWTGDGRPHIDEQLKRPT
jgi:predicted ester cyclase